jgi:hypothetical protein
LEKIEVEKRKREDGNVKLAAKLAAERAAREEITRRLHEEEEEIAKKRMFLGAAKNMLEERHFMQHTRGAERQALNRQTAAQMVHRREIYIDRYIDNSISIDISIHK